MCHIRESDFEDVYIVKSQSYDGVEYKIDTKKWHCTCTIAWTGKPTGEPCKHQAAVAQKYNLVSMNYIPYFNAEGRYPYAVLAVGIEKAGDKSFYDGLNHNNSEHSNTDVSCVHSAKNDTHKDMGTKYDEGATNLDINLGLMEDYKLKQLKESVVQLRNEFISDIDSRIEQMDTNYISSLNKFLTRYMDTVKKIEPLNSATPQLSSLLHSHFAKTETTCIAGTRRITVQPTALARRRSGIARGSQHAPSGRPPKRPVSGEDCYVQTKWGKQDHTKRRHRLHLNVKCNQLNPFKHGQGH